MTSALPVYMSSCKRRLKDGVCTPCYAPTSLEYHAMRRAVIDVQCPTPPQSPEGISAQNAVCHSCDSRAASVIMRYPTAKVSLVAALCLIAAAHARADTMRCGDKLVMAGDSMAAVRAYCGRPAVVQHGYAVSTAAERSDGHEVSQPHTASAAVPVDTWTYNRGPKKLLVTIRFVDGSVVAVNILSEYGY